MVIPLSPTTTVDASFHGFIARFVGRWFGEVYRHGQGGFEGAWWSCTLLFSKLTCPWKVVVKKTTCLLKWPLFTGPCYSSFWGKLGTRDIHFWWGPIPAPNRYQCMSDWPTTIGSRCNPGISGRSAPILPQASMLQKRFGWGVEKAWTGLRVDHVEALYSALSRL